MDLFAGIGGIRLGFERTGKVRTVFSSEIDKNARTYYEKNFGDTPAGDITQIPLDEIPYADIIAGGIPCQAFSILGKKKGLSDERGQLFYRFIEIVKAKQPKAFFIENVRNLFCHDKGRTFKSILQTMKEELGYTLYYHVYNSAEWGVPQIRRRIYIVGFRDELPFLFPSSFEFLKRNEMDNASKRILERNAHRRHYIGKKEWCTFKREIGASKRNGFTAKLLKLNTPATTLTTRRPQKSLIKDTPLKNTFIQGDTVEKNSEGMRYLTPREMARLQAFPESFLVPESHNMAAKLFGNSVTVEVVYQIAKSIIKALETNARFSPT